MNNLINREIILVSRPSGIPKSENFLINELGFDAAINYKSTSNLVSSLADACPRGVDVYFDNVGGFVTDSVMHHINYKSRIAVCGQIAHYNSDSYAEIPDLGPRTFPQILNKSAMVQGFIVSDSSHLDEEAVASLSQWQSEGRLKYRESIVEGLENAPNALIGILRGENIGKQIVRVSTDSILN